MTTVVNREQTLDGGGACKTSGLRFPEFSSNVRAICDIQITVCLQLY